MNIIINFLLLVFVLTLIMWTKILGNLMYFYYKFSNTCKYIFFVYFESFHFIERNSTNNMVLLLGIKCSVIWFVVNTWIECYFKLCPIHWDVKLMSIDYTVLLKIFYQLHYIINYPWSREYYNHIFFPQK